MRHLVTMVRVTDIWKLHSEPMQPKPHMLRNRFISSSPNQTSGSIYRIEWKWPYLLVLRGPQYHRFNPTALAEFWNSELTVSQQWREGSHAARSVTRQLFLSTGYSFYSQQTLHEYTNKCITILGPFEMRTDSLLALWKCDYCSRKIICSRANWSN